MALLLRPAALTARPARSRTGRGLGARRAAGVRASAERQDVASQEMRLSGANQLEALRSVTRLVIDTGDIDAIAKHKPEVRAARSAKVHRASDTSGLPLAGRDDEPLVRIAHARQGDSAPARRALHAAADWRSIC
jgi:hypothetical protein